jgi:flagellar hook-associated protein 2
MSSPIAGFSGLASGIQWRDIVDQIMAVEESRTVTPITTRIDQRTAQRAAWTTFLGLTNTLNDSARALRAGGIGGFLATASPSPTTSRALVSAAASSTAAPGTYKVEVMQLAQSSKVSGGTVSNVKTALGLTGDFSVNGKSISVVPTDTLETVRTKINGANAGLAPSGVSAAIMSDGATGGRLVLSRTTPGATGVEIEDGTGGIARELGFLDSRSRTVSSTVTAIASALGLQTTPSPASIRVDGRLISVDLETESLGAIVAKINAAGGQASIASEAYGAETRYRLVTQGNVSAVAGDAESQAIIDALDLGAGGYGDVKQTVSTGVFTDATDSIATAATELAGLKVGGQSADLAVGDAINIRGMRGDGTAVTIGITIADGDTMQDLLDRINDATSGFGSGVRPATAVLASDGTIRLTDGTGGESRLSMTLATVHADDTTGSLGTATVALAGRNRELSAGQDAMVKVDGVVMTRSSNIVADAISGVTLNLLNAEPGTVVDLKVSHNDDDGVKAVKAFADAYNAVVKFFDEQRATGQPLNGSSSLRGVVSSFTAALRTGVATNATYGRLSLMGVELDRNGVLKVNESAARKALSEKPAEVEALFGFDGVGGALVTATDGATAFGNGAVSSQIRSIDEGSFALLAKKADAVRRLELRRQALVEQYTRMERALSALNSQSSYLSQQLKALQAS